MTLMLLNAFKLLGEGEIVLVGGERGGMPYNNTGAVSVGKKIINRLIQDGSK